MMKNLTPSVLEKKYVREADLLKDVKAYLEGQPDVMCMPIRDRYARGYSDLFVCVNGKFGVIELKDDIGKATVHQELFIAKARKHGAAATVARTLREVVDLVEKLRSS